MKCSIEQLKKTEDAISASGACQASLFLPEEREAGLLLKIQVEYNCPCHGIETESRVHIQSVI